MKNILITGALGQDGIILSKKFLKKKFKVIGLVKKINQLKVKKVKYIKSDLSSKKKIVKILSKFNPDIIYHLASSNDSYAKRKKGNFINNYSYNYECAKNLIDALFEKNSKCKFIFAGSSLMFDNQKNIINEKTSFKVNDLYSKYKIDIHNYLLKKFNNTKTSFITAILFNHDSIYRNKKFLIPRIIKSCYQKDLKFLNKIYKLNISGDFSNANDVCEGLLNLGLKKININKIILSSNKRFYINKAIRYLVKTHGLKIKFLKTNHRRNKKVLGSNKLAKKLIKFKPTENFLKLFKELNDHFLLQNK